MPSCQEYIKSLRIPNIPLPGFTEAVPGWVPYEVWCQPRPYKNDDDGWHRVVKRPARRQREKTRWMGSVQVQGLAAIIPALQITEA